ncbi:hypothetical protein [Humisphaera borealis]|uniref:Uncharacterized protein n=1 Tax=Humisphaera borealis TaxID=2807512 RepID=A0A7M2X156_9BACT|nr:hypothetical protein [Humisphaera borealis]QOV91172.1 hypothetical protein IPV69_07380 [Humisphaera borealis]
MSTKPDDSTSEPRERSWLIALLLVAICIAIIPLGLGLLFLYYALVIGMEGSTGALKLGLVLVAASIVWAIFFGWLKQWLAARGSLGSDHRIL